MAYEKVVIRKIKRPEGILRWPTYVLGKDQYGLWLYSPKGTICRGQVGTDYVESEVGKGNRPEAAPVMHLIPEERWWIASWCLDCIFVDICTPPRLMDGEWQYIDLELDPLSFLSGRIVIEDEDEFAEACEMGLIPKDEALAARNATTEVEQWFHDKTEPFGRVGWEKLEEAVKLSLSPIRELNHISSVP